MSTLTDVLNIGAKFQNYNRTCVCESGPIYCGDRVSGLDEGWYQFARLEHRTRLFLVQVQDPQTRLLSRGIKK